MLACYGVSASLRSFPEQYAARMRDLAEFTLITLVPFIPRLVVAPLTPKAICCALSFRRNPATPAFLLAVCCSRADFH